MSLAADAGTLMGLAAARTEEMGATYNVLDIGEALGFIENYTLIPVDQEGFVVVENRIFLE